MFELHRLVGHLPRRVRDQVDSYLETLEVMTQMKDPRVRAALHLGLEQLLFLDGIPDHAAIGEAVELAKPSRGHRVVNAVLRRVQREGVDDRFDVHYYRGDVVVADHPRIVPWPV